MQLDLTACKAAFEPRAGRTFRFRSNQRPRHRRAGGLPGQGEFRSTSAGSVPALMMAAIGHGFVMGVCVVFQRVRRTVSALGKKLAVSVYDHLLFPERVFVWGRALGGTRADEREGTRGHTRGRSTSVCAGQSSGLRRVGR
jgi:hypothetical protein